MTALNFTRCADIAVCWPFRSFHVVKGDDPGGLWILANFILCEEGCKIIPRILLNGFGHEVFTRICVSFRNCSFVERADLACFAPL